MAGDFGDVQLSSITVVICEPTRSMFCNPWDFRTLDEHAYSASVPFQLRNTIPSLKPFDSADTSETFAHETVPLRDSTANRILSYIGFILPQEKSRIKTEAGCCRYGSLFVDKPEAKSLQNRVPVHAMKALIRPSTLRPVALCRRTAVETDETWRGLQRNHRRVAVHHAPTRFS